MGSSLPINPGAISKNKINAPKDLPIAPCLLSNNYSSEVNIDSFQETLRKTNVNIITQAATLRTVSKGIGKSPTLPMP